MSNYPTESVGRLIARALTGSWRAHPTALDLEAAELSSITPQLIAAGMAGLAWRRLRNSGLKETAAAAQLRAQYERDTAMALLLRQRIESPIRELSLTGIKPVLVKGWAAARLYPDTGVRPYVDIDLCVERSQFEMAGAALERLPKKEVAVDLHREFATLGGGAWQEIYARAEVVRLGETEVLVPSAEDHLRILAIHMLREGAWRPMWLCDVAAAVESRRDSFDWEVCFGRTRQSANWICCALKLAHELLGADISDTPADDVQPLPQWLTLTVLKEWGTPAPSMSLRHQAPMASHLRSGTFVSGFRDRWPNAIEGTVVSGGLFNGLPRFPFQLKAYMMRGAHFAFGRSRIQRDR